MATIPFGMLAGAAKAAARDDYPVYGLFMEGHWTDGYTSANKLWRRKQNMTAFPAFDLIKRTHGNPPSAR